MKTNKRLSFMDFSAIISSFAVVTLHSAGGNFHFDSVSLSGTLTILFQIIFSFGVPMFFMQSGANVLNYRDRYSTKAFWKKRINKVIIPFLFWSLIGYLFLMATNDITHGTILNFMYRLITNTILGPYWFFYNIIAFYFCVPVLSAILNTLKTATLNYFIFLTIAVNTIFIPILGLLHSPNLYFFSIFPIIGGYLEYFLIGWYIIHIGINKAWQKRIYWAACLAFLFELIATPLITFRINNLSKVVFDISNFPALLVMTGLFLYLSTHNDFFSRMQKPLMLFAKLTFGIYLIHPYVIWGLSKIIVISSSTIHLFVFPIIVYLVSGLLVFILRFLPFVKRILP